MPPTHLHTLITVAQAAEQRADWPAALGHWENIRLLHPTDPAGHLGVGIALQQLGHLPQADAILTSGLQQFPTDPHLLLELARTAYRAENWPVALQRWNAFRTVQPDNPEGPAGASVALQLLNRLEEADSVLAEALIRFPTHPPTAIEYARVAMRRNDWTQALYRWRHVVTTFPQDPEGPAGLGTSLQILSRLDEAETCLSAARLRFPHHPGIAIEYARIAHRRADWPLAYSRWQDVIAQFPDHPDGYASASVALQLQNRHMELETLLFKAVQRFPAHEGLAIDYARAAHTRGDWTVSRRRWEAALQRFPANQTMQDGLNSAAFQENLARLDQPTVTAPTPDPPRRHGTRVADLSPTEVMLHFEGLGSGCEFGLVQRHFGAEPLGLLRWGAIPALALARALEARFEGFGKPAEIELFEFGDSREYFFRDKLYMMEMHTFVPVDGSDYDRVFAQQIRRSAFLKDKLLADLDSDPRDAKIFVYKHHTGRISDPEASALHDAIRRYGDHALLCVRPAEDGQTDGTLSQSSHGLLFGYLNNLSPTNHSPDIEFNSWLTLCRAALELWKGNAVTTRPT